MAIGEILDPGADIAALEKAADECFESPLLFHIDPGAVRFDQRLANWLSELPELAEAHRGGRIHDEHLDKLRRADNPRCHQRLIADQHKFVTWFTRCHFRDLDQIIDHWLLGADPDGAEAVALRSKEQEAGITSTVRRRTLDALLNLVVRGTARPDSTPLHPLYALAATATATFRRLVYGARGRPIDVSNDSRRIPDWMRDVTLVTTNGKCANPICDAPFGWLHADHVTPYSHTHSTKLDDTRPLCEGDNLWRGNDVTRGVWATELDWEDDVAVDAVDAVDADDDEVAHQTVLARARIRQLVAAAA